MTENPDKAEYSPVDLLYILGPGHCGSTLLNLCLDRHSSVMGVSEIVALNRRRPGWSSDEDILALPFWSEVDQRMRKSGESGLSEVPFDFSGMSPSDMSQALRLNHAASQAILGVAGKTVLADASKDPYRLAALLGSPLFRVRVVYLVRDGRAVIHAYRRKYGTWFRGWRKLMRTDRAARLMKTQSGGGAWLTVRYEDMVTDLDGTLRRICEFTNIDFELEMLEPDTTRFNGVGGNRLRKRPVERIALDTAWKTDMPTADKVFAGLTVARFNRRYGYRG